MSDMYYNPDDDQSLPPTRPKLTVVPRTDESDRADPEVLALRDELQRTQVQAGMFFDAVASRPLAYILILADPVTMRASWYANEPWGDEQIGPALARALLPELNKIAQAAIEKAGGVVEAEGDDSGSEGPTDAD